MHTLPERSSRKCNVRPLLAPRILGPPLLHIGLRVSLRPAIVMTGRLLQDGDDFRLGSGKRCHVHVLASLIV